MPSANFSLRDRRTLPMSCCRWTFDLTADRWPLLRKHVLVCAGPSAGTAAPTTSPHGVRWPDDPSPAEQLCGRGIGARTGLRAPAATAAGSGISSEGEPKPGGPVFRTAWRSGRVHTASRSPRTAGGAGGSIEGPSAMVRGRLPRHLVPGPVATTRVGPNAGESPIDSSDADSASGERRTPAGMHVDG